MSRTCDYYECNGVAVRYVMVKLTANREVLEKFCFKHCHAINSNTKSILSYRELSPEEVIVLSIMTE
jgi:hypothetical protein